MSFVNETDVIDLMERMIKNLLVLFGGFLKILLLGFPIKMLWKVWWIVQFEKPLEIVDLSDIVKDCELKVFEPAGNKNGRVALLRAPEASSITRSQIDSYTNLVSQHGAKGLAYIKINDLEKGSEGLQSPILKFLSESVVNEILMAAGARNGDSYSLVQEKVKS